MIIGNPSICALESEITVAYESESLLALGYFVIHINGRCYGKRERDSTMLGCSYYAVEARAANRGRHTAPFAGDANAGDIADAVSNAIFADDAQESYFGIPYSVFVKMFYTQSVDRMWAPDGDKAFDDGSRVLQFDVGDRVRLIAFRCGTQSGREYLHDPDTLAEVWLEADEFYAILQQWHSAFASERATMLKNQLAGG